MSNELDVDEHICEEAIRDAQGNQLIAMSEDESEFYRKQRSDQARDL